MAAQTAPCSWDLDYVDCASCDSLTDTSEAAKFEAAATEYLWNWTGRRFGLCTTSIRPCREDCGSPSTYWGGGPSGVWSGAPWRPVIVGGSWTNISCGHCGEDACGCGSVPTLKLPGPVYRIDSIYIDGRVVPSGNYRVDNDKYLVRTDGGSWPKCQDMRLPVTEEDTFEINYTFGVAPPQGGRIAAATLACELAKAACNDASCKLPQRVQSISRQGVTIAVLDAFEDIDTGHTGIWIIDSWVASVMKSPMASTVHSPDVKRKYVRTTPYGPGLPSSGGGFGE